MSEHDVSRRDFLKRGALLGGALVWTTPVVQVVGMNPALAQVPSPACNVWYAIKIEFNADTGQFVCESIHNQTSTDPGFGSGKCLDVQAIEQANNFDAVDGGCEQFSAVLQSVEISEDGKRWTVPFPENCQAESGDCAAKVGQGQSAGCVQGACTWDPENRELVFEVTTTNAISHVEFVFCCSD
jgi:hypothetical protein